MRLAVLIFIPLLSSLVPMARCDSRSAGAVSWDTASPQDVKRYALDACLDEVQVGVLLADRTSLEGKITAVRSDDFTMAPKGAEPLAVNFASVRRIFWRQWKESKASRIRYQVRDLATKPDLVATVRPRHQPELSGRIGPVRELSFVLVEQKTGGERELAYRDVERIYAPEVHAGPSASEVFHYVLIAAEGILLFPLIVLAVLSGWDGC